VFENDRFQFCGLDVGQVIAVDSNKCSPQVLSNVICTAVHVKRFEELSIELGDIDPVEQCVVIDRYIDFPDWSPFTYVVSFNGMYLSHSKSVQNLDSDFGCNQSVTSVFARSQTTEGR
jgi:hypothetical protein